MREKVMPFSGKDLQKIIIPLFLEQLLVMLVGIAVAMVCDWVTRAVISIWRQKSGKWKEFQVI